MSDNLKFEVIENFQEIEKFVHNIYCKELRWQPPDPNPSGFREEKVANGECILTDDIPLGEKGFWFGVKNSLGELVMGGRCQFSTIGKFECCLYHDIPAELKSGPVIELNRVAILKEYRTPRTVAFTIFSLVLEFQNRGIESIFCAATLEELGQLLVEIGFQRNDKYRFRYHANDKDFVEIIHFTLKKKQKILKNCKKYFIEGLS